MGERQPCSVTKRSASRQLAAGSRSWRLTLAASVGNGLEWYDFAVYGAMAATLGRVFFPASDPGAALLQSFAVFAVGYLMRPVGSLVLGPLGDRVGRGRLLQVSMLVMALASLLIGLLPGHDAWGLAAGRLLILLRMLQGFSLGGEYTGAMTYAVEVALPGRRGWLGSFTAAGSMLGMVGGSLSATLVQSTLSTAALLAWGWRLPFLLAGAIALLALWLRRDLPEPGTAAAAALPSAAEFRRCLRADGRRILQVLALLAFEKISFYLVFVFWVQRAISLQPGQAATFNGLTTLVQALGIPLILLAGHWADRHGGLSGLRRWCLLLALLIAPAMQLQRQASLGAMGLGLVLAAVPLMLIAGTYPALIPFQFDPRSRCTAFSFSYSLGGSLLGGTAPALAAWMLARPGWQQGPLLYTLFWAVPALLVLPRLRGQPPVTAAATP